MLQQNKKQSTIHKTREHEIMLWTPIFNKEFNREWIQRGPLRNSSIEEKELRTDESEKIN